MMSIFSWIILAVLAGLAGASLVQYLVCAPLRMSRYLLLSLTLVVGTAVWGVFAIPPLRALAGALLALTCFICGYLVMTWLFLSQKEKRSLPPITRQPGEKGKGHTAVVYFTHGEPPGYDPSPWLETMHEFDHDKAAFIPFPLRPFFFHALRKEYLRAGGSPHNKIHHYLCQAVQVSMPETLQKESRFYLAYLDSNPRPDEMAIRAMNEGADRIILLPIFITISSHTQAGREMVAALEPEKYGVALVEAEPLWNSALLQEYFVVRANVERGELERDKVGVLLVGHGQPEAWDAIYPTQTQHENLYREGIKQHLVRDGYRAEKVVLTWMSFQRPFIAEGLRLLAASGVEQILVFPVSISADSLHSEVDVPHAVEKTHLSKNIRVIHMGAFGDPFDSLVVGAIREKILACFDGQ
jgi:protoheme ferro-lyase